jgi:hypothetical protein
MVTQIRLGPVVVNRFELSMRASTFRHVTSLLLQYVGNGCKNSLKRIIGLVLLPLFLQAAEAQQILEVIEPGIGFAKFKQWAIENQLVFENFTKDSLVVRDTGLNAWETIRIQVRFCGGDDYSGRASNIIIQQLFKPEIDAVVMQRDYVEFLSGKASSEGKFSGTFSVRRDRKDGNPDGLAVGQDAGEKGYWEVGLFKKDELDVTRKQIHFALLQTIRRRDSICQ